MSPLYINACLLFGYHQSTIAINCLVHKHSMEAFYSRCLIEEERLLNDLLSVPQDRPDLQIPLISRMLSQCAEYYNHKSQLAERDIFQVFSALWLTPVERTFLWLGGLKADIIFHFVPLSHSNDQRREMEELKRQVVQRQIELEERMRHIQDAMTVLMTLAAVHGHVRNGEARGEAALMVAEMMRVVFYDADTLRRHAVTRIIQILSTAQTVLFLVSAVNFHLRLRQYGLNGNARA